MTDRYQQFTSSALGRRVVKTLGMPNPPQLTRHQPGQPTVSSPVLLGAAANGRLVDNIRQTLRDVRAEITEAPTPGKQPADDADDQDGASAANGQRYAAMVFDATGITGSEQLWQLYEFISPVIRKTARCGRIIVFGTPPENLTDPHAATAQRALEGFVRTAGKEIGNGATAQLVYVAEGNEGVLGSTARFLLSAKSAYVSGQVVRIGNTAATTAGGLATETPLDGKVALVTGASRGIGASIAETLARDGAHVVCLDVPAQGGDLSTVANHVGGSALQLDITAADAPQRIAEHFTARHDGLDIVVHNAGITRDKTIKRMSRDQWDSVIEVNLSAPERINDLLLSEQSPLRSGGRIIGVSSIAGIAGNVGQANYGTSKAGVIGYVHANAPRAAERGVTINAVAPGFIETQMTGTIPLFIREAGRRMNSMSQGGLPVDVAETIAWYAHPASSGVNGNLVRVCGQSLLGA